MPETSQVTAEVAAFNAALAAVAEHNEQFSMGRMMFGALQSHFRAEQRTAELTAEGLSEEEAREVVAFTGDDQPGISDQQSMGRSILDLEVTPVFAQAGLVISPIRTTTTMFGPGGEQKVGEVRLQVADGAAFTDFLDRVAQTKGAADEAFLEGLERVAQNYVAEVSNAIATGAVDDNTLEGLTYAGGAASAMSRLGITSSCAATGLRELSTHAQAGLAREYVLAKRVGILDRPGTTGTFGPSQWQQDATPEYLAKRWHEVLDVITEANGNPKAETFATELAGRAVGHLAFAMKDWAASSAARAAAGSDDSYGQGFDQVFAAVGRQLETLSPGVTLQAGRVLPPRSLGTPEQGIGF